MFLGIDLGGTNLKFCIIDRKKRTLFVDEQPSYAEKGRNFVIKQIVNICVEQINHFKKEIRAVGIGAPGPLNSQKGIIYEAPNLIGWRNVQLKKIVEQKIKINVFLQNDANCAAIAEKELGSAKNFDDFVLLTLGTGVGGAIFINGKIYEGSYGSAGELGHIRISLDENFRCGCGSYGCLEAYCNSSALGKFYNNSNLTPYDIYLNAKSGDNCALKAFEIYGNYLGIGLSSIVNIFNPQAIILCGGISKAYNFFYKSMNNAMKKFALSTNLKSVSIKKSQLQEKSGSVGAALWALFHSDFGGYS